jgi:hypothetical protein
MKNLPPAAAPPGRWRLFFIAHSSYYNYCIFIIVCLHLLLTLVEAPPSLYDNPSSIETSGYWPRWRTILFDVIICVLYDIHSLITIRLEGFRSLRCQQVLVIVALLNIDMLVNAGAHDVRPFRCLRPFVYTFVSVQQTMMLNCCESLSLQSQFPCILIFIAFSFYIPRFFQAFEHCSFYSRPSSFCFLE